MVKYTPGWTRRNQAARLNGFDPDNREQAIDDYLDLSEAPDPKIEPDHGLFEKVGGAEYCEMIKRELKSKFLDSAIGGGWRLIRMLQRLEARISANGEDSTRVLDCGLKGDRAGEIRTRLNKQLELIRAPLDKAGRRPGESRKASVGRVTDVEWVLERTAEGLDSEKSTKMTFHYFLRFAVKLPLHLRPGNWMPNNHVVFKGGWRCVWDICDISTGRLETDSGSDSGSQPLTMSTEATGLFIRPAQFFQTHFFPPDKKKRVDQEKGEGSSEAHKLPKRSKNFTSRTLGLLADAADPTVENAQLHRRSRARLGLGDLLTECSVTMDKSSRSEGLVSFASALVLGAENAWKHRERRPFGVKAPILSVTSAGEQPLAEDPPLDRDSRLWAGSDGEKQTEKKRFRFAWRRTKPRSDEASDTGSEGGKRHQRLVKQHPKRVDSMLSECETEPDDIVDDLVENPHTAASSSAPQPRSLDSVLANQPIPPATERDDQLKAETEKFALVTTNSLNDRWHTLHRKIMARYEIPREERNDPEEVMEALEEEQAAISKELYRRRAASHVGRKLSNIPDLTLSTPSSAETQPQTTVDLDERLDAYTMPSTYNEQISADDRLDSLAGRTGTENSASLAPSRLQKERQKRTPRRWGGWFGKKKAGDADNERNFPASTHGTSLTEQSNSLQQSTMPPSSNATRDTT